MTEIRNAREEDVAALVRFEIEISVVSFGVEAITDAAHHENRLRKAMKKDGCAGMFVLMCGGEIAGWLWMERKTNFLTGDAYANFRSFYITENLRGKPESEDFLSYGIDWCKKQGLVRIAGKVHSSNLPMRALYKKAGFRATHLTMELDTAEGRI